MEYRSLKIFSRCCHLKFKSYLTVPLQKSSLGLSSFVPIAHVKQFWRRAIWTHVPYLVVTLSQWIHAWWKFPLTPLIQSMPYLIEILNTFMIEAEHYQMRSDLATLLNAFLKFDREHNSNSHQVLKITCEECLLF